MSRGDRARVTVRVAVAPDAAFRAFTEEIDLWWRRGVRFRAGGAGPGTLTFEPGMGGRLLESYPTPDGERVREAGRITAWQPPSHLAFEWRNQNFAPHERTEVEVRFEDVAGGTLVHLEHRGWAALRDDHPARHGLVGPPFARMIGLWWADVLSGFREHVAA